MLAATKIAFAFCQFLLLEHMLCRKLIVTDVEENAKIACDNNVQLVFTVQSEMQCHQRCLAKPNCEILNYKESDGESERGNCEVFLVSSASYQDLCSVPSSRPKWRVVVLEREDKVVKKVYDSCKEILEEKPGAASGVYELRSGKHHCIMSDVQGCGAGGWTLVMKINGAKDTFKATSSYWTNNNVYKVEDGLRSFESEESKFPGFNSIRMQSICMGIKVNGVTKWIKAAKSSTSLLEVFKTGTYQSTSFGRSKWLSLISGSELQANCNREGFNVQNPGRMYVRIGIIANQENDCNTPDSFVGFGIDYNSFCNAGITKVSCGNFATCHTKEQSIAAMGFIMVQ